MSLAKPIIWILAGIVTFVAATPVAFMAGRQVGSVAIIAGVGCFTVALWYLFRETGPIGRVAYGVASSLVIVCLILVFGGDAIGQRHWPAQSANLYARVLGWLVFTAFVASALAVLALGADVKNRRLRK